MHEIVTFEDCWEQSQTRELQVDEKTGLNVLLEIFEFYTSYFISLKETELNFDEIVDNEENGKCIIQATDTNWTYHDSYCMTHTASLILYAAQTVPQSSATLLKAISKIAGTSFGLETLKSEHLLTGILCKALSSKLPYSIVYHVSSIYSNVLLQGFQ